MELKTDDSEPQATVESQPQALVGLALDPILKEAGLSGIVSDYTWRPAIFHLFSQLPSALQHEVMFYLDHTDVSLRVPRVCKQWCRLADYSPLWRSLFEAATLTKPRFGKGSSSSPSSSSSSSSPSSSSLGSSRKMQFKTAWAQWLESQKSRYKALFDFEGTDNDDLSFKVGDVLELVESEDAGWLKCKLKDKTGFVPGNYLELIVPPK